MNKHTQGPWMIEGLSGNRHEGHVIVSDSADRTIAWTCNSLISDRDADEEYISPEDQANARLISSAPDLLEALELYDEFSKSNDDWRDDDDTPDFVIKARQAIAKAKGVSDE